MNRHILVVAFTIVVLMLISCDASMAPENDIVGEPITLTEDSSVRKLTIDEKISESEIIVIGEVTTALPTKWKFNDMKDVKDATPQEIIDAGGLFTDFLISIDQVLKGSVDDPTIRVRSFSGETNKVRWENSSQPVYVENKVYVLFLRQDSGPTAKVDPGDFISVNSNTAVYEIVDGKAISADDEWLLEDLIAYIEKSLSGEAPSSDVDAVETPFLDETSTATP